MRTEKGGACRGAAKVKNNGEVAVREKKMALIRAISAPFLDQSLHGNLNKLLTSLTIKNT